MAAHNILHPLKNGYYLQIYRQINIFLPIQLMIKHTKKKS